MPKYTAKYYINAVRCKDGNIRKLKITPRPLVPDHMKVGPNEV